MPFSVQFTLFSLKEGKYAVRLGFDDGLGDCTIVFLEIGASFDNLARYVSYNSWMVR